VSTVLDNFKEEFTFAKLPAAVTWGRDVVPVFAEAEDAGAIPWAIAVPKNPTEQMLFALALKWAMDVDEFFYLGDLDHEIKGLLNGDFEDGPNVLLTPELFGNVVVRGDLKGELPCKWLMHTKHSRFSYAKDKLLFRVCWPTLVGPASGDQVYFGAMFPLGEVGA
jgi:hypothetical protein